MRLSVALLVLFVANNASEERKTTLSADERVRIIKDNLKKDLRSKHGIKIQPIDEPNEFESYEHDDNSPITPIMEYDERKKDDMFKLKKIKTKATLPTTATWVKSIVTERTEAVHKDLRNQPYSFTQQRATTSARVSKPVEIFYRKMYSNNIDLDEPIEWLHCTEMVSPYLVQAKKELTKPIRITKKDHVVVRLIQLLTMNTTDFTKDEVYSVLYQISKLKIRFFLWDLEAMKLVFNVITKDYPGRIHSFKALKSGLKKLLDSWHLDRSNTTRLLLQSRVFRPPCVPKPHKGSSRFVPGSTLTPPATVAKNADDDDSGADCQNRAHDHGN